MKKFIWLIIAVGFVFSCSHDSEQKSYSQTKGARVLNQLKALNDSFSRNNLMTRSIPDPKVNRMAQVDAAARVAAVSEFVLETINKLDQLHFTPQQIVDYLDSDNFKRCCNMYADAAAASASQKAAKRSGDCAIIEIVSTTSSATFLNAYSYYKIKERDSLSAAVDESELDDIELPLAYDYIISAGYDHNGIIRHSITSNLILHPLSLNTCHVMNDLEEPIHEDPLLPDTEVDSIFNDTAFISQFDNFYLLVEDYMNSYILDYSALLESICGTNDLCSQIAELYLDAIMYCDSNDDMISLANSYINIVEANSILDNAEKERLYSCFVVGVASYALWSELIEIEDI